MLEPSEGKSLGFNLIVAFFDVLAFSILKESLKINASWPLAEWDSQAKSLNYFFRQKDEEIENSLLSSFGNEEKSTFLALNQFLKKYFQNFINQLAKFIAEEQRISLSLNEWLKKLDLAEDKEEIYAAIREIIQPPMGIVTNVTPKNKEIFEETVTALRKINLPEFIHSLYLYHVGAINLISLKPAEKGLNELSITLNYIIKQKEKVVMAVTGDSGTGKTYFCQVLACGCAGLKPEEILYLRRDSKEGRKIFNRLIGRN